MTHRVRLKQRIRGRVDRDSAAPPSPVLLVFLKAPRPGYVKTRLAREVGTEEAVRVYRTLAEGQLRRVPENFRVEVHYAPRGARAEMQAWLGTDLHYCVQPAGDLGRRLAHAFARAFRRGATAVMAIGADCPELDGACLNQALQRLGEADVVLGPASDGGYYLIALRRPTPGIFAGIAWGSTDVLRQTRRRAADSGLSCALLPVKEDIDDLASLRRHLSRDRAFASLRDLRGSIPRLRLGR